MDYTSSILIWNWAFLLACQNKGIPMEVKFVEAKHVTLDNQWNVIQHMETKHWVSGLAFKYIPPTEQDQFLQYGYFKKVQGSFIIVVVQDNIFKTSLVFIHELLHILVYKWLFDSRKLHGLIDKYL
jgi:hypothetical protein